MRRFTQTWQTNWTKKTQRFIPLLAFLVVFGGLGTMLLVNSHATTPTASLQAEGGVTSSAATNVADTTASGGQAVKFGSGTTGGGGGCPGDRTISGWPSATNVGLLCTTTRNMGGLDLDSKAAFVAAGFTGTGTSANPYTIDRVHFTSDLTIGSWSTSDLGGVYVKFTNCRFDGNPGIDPTPPGSSMLDITRPNNVAGVTVADSTLGPKGTISPTGGPDPTVGGVDKVIITTVPLTVLRDNLFGGNIAVYFNANDTTNNLIQDSYLHDTWSSRETAIDKADHTDLVNGNPSASHVAIRHNYFDGIRTGNSVVTNCVGMYDDNGPITDWTIDRNYFDHCATILLSNTSTSRFTNPYVVTNNVFYLSHAGKTGEGEIVGIFSMRAPSVQSGNVDENGNPVTLN